MDDIGPSNYSVYLKTVDDFYAVRGGRLYCDETTYMNNRECDPAVGAKFCNTNQSFYEKPNPMWLPLLGTVKYLFIEPTSYPWERFFCTGPAYISTRDQESFTYYSPAEMLNKTMFYKTFDFSYLVYVKSRLVETGCDSFACETKTVIDGDFMGLRPNVTFMIFARVEEYGGFLEAISVIEIAIDAGCMNTAVGQTCWLTCTDDARKTCNCVDYRIVTPTPCNITCKKGWLVQHHEKKIADFIYKLNSCLYRDYCLDENMKKRCPTQSCITYENNTGCCSTVKPLIWVNGIIDATDATIYFNKENIRFSLYEDIYCRKMTEAYETKFDDIYLQEEITDLQEYQDAYFTVILEKNDLLIMNHIFYHVSLYLWDILLDFNRSFYVFDTSHTMFINHAHSNEPVQYRICLGETLLCNHSGLPLFYTVVYIDAKLYGIELTFTEKVHFDQNLNLNSWEVFCRATVLTQYRKVYTKLISVHTQLDQYISFKWVPEDNLINSDQILICELDSFLTDARLLVEQIEGEQDLPITVNFVMFDNIFGGSYSCLCILTLNNTVLRSIITSFSLQTLPKEICYFIIPRVRGSIIQCTHNGYLRDEYFTEVNIIYSSEEIYTSPYYARLSYSYEKQTVIVICSLFTITGTEVLSNETYTYELSIKTYEVYAILKSTLLCTSHELRVEHLDIKSQTDESITLYHRVFYPIFNNAIFLLPLYVFIYTLLPVVEAAYVSQISQLLLGSCSNLLQIQRMSHAARVRKLQDRLANEGFKIMLMHKKGHRDTLLKSNEYYRSISP